MGLLTKLFGSHSEKAIRQITPVVDKIEALADRYAAMPEDELKSQTAIFKKRLANGEDLEDILPEAFAVVREASRRVIGLYHYRVQLIGGVVLHQGRIAEMKTGEGKTLVATLPVYLNALTGNGVHVVTVNDYLAARDSEWMGKIYKYLGLSVGLIVHGLDNDARRAAYAADVTYGTNNELGFDYLRDNMVTYKEMMVQRKLSFAIVDEVDSILIDEARTPLIISGMGEESSDLYEKADKFVRRLSVVKVTETDDKQDFDEIKEDADYIIDEKAKTAILTTRGVRKAEEYFKITNLADQENYQINHHINNALKAQGIMHRDQDYVLKDGEVIIVDDFTGRLMMGRRYSNGLHQAIEAKEGVKVEKENKTLATITFQNFFRMYQKLSGMTGTALTEENEFRTIYNLDVVSIPTNMPMIRLDEPDSVYKTQQGKYTALLREVQSAHSQGQPILIGTISVEKSEKLSSLFRKNGIPHNVLNAKQHDKEAEIVAQAGRFGGVTIATNMAGRGTDILLGGNPEFLAKQDMRKQGYDDDLVEAATTLNETTDSLILEARNRFRGLHQRYQEQCALEREKVIQAGGLLILGTERHESRRIDNQLRGRAGRQGDPGRSRFFLSLDDDLMRLFGGERMTTVFAALGVEEDMEIQHKMLSNAIESAQKKVEGRNFSIRKHVLEYDDVMNKQREIIYGQRRQVLEGENLQGYYRKMISQVMQDIMLDFCANLPNSNDWDIAAIQARVQDVFGPLDGLRQLANYKQGLDAETLTETLVQEALERYENRVLEIGSADLMREAERAILLRTVDNKWMDHIDMMDDLRDSIGMRSYAQHDPIVEYRREGFDMFDAMTSAIREDAVRMIMRARFSSETVTRRHSVARNLAAAHATADGFAEQRRAIESGFASGPSATAGRAAASVPARRDGDKVGRNDPCPCGSGKKYKNCHGRTGNI
jgi:preprotein translocase subunit SecA